MAKLGHAALSLLMLIPVLGAAAGLAGCFIESAQSSTFRFECGATDQCNEGEVCSDGLCQQPCGAGEEACSGSAFCLNGFCSSICPIGDDVCPTPQECVGLSGSDPEPGSSGVCTVLCDDTDHPCGDGQLCLAGFCATQCMSVDECSSGEECLEVAPGLSVCTPSSSGGSGFP